MESIVYYDLETAGLLLSQPITQIGAVAASATGEIIDAFFSRVAFDESVADPSALELTHYCREDYIGAPSPDEVVEKFSRWLRRFKCVEFISKKTGNPFKVAQMAGYNAPLFDDPRLQAMYAGKFFPGTLSSLDVKQKVQWCLRNRRDKPENYKLETVAQFLGVPLPMAHNALDDSLATAQISHTVQQEYFLNG